MVGAISLARQIQIHEIWMNKPSWWFKVWTFILMTVNHTGNQNFKRGSYFFNREGIYDGCRLVNDGIKPKSVDNVIRWLKSVKMITTQKTTRGMIVNVCNYSHWQKWDTYRNDMKNDGQNDTGTTQERHRNDTINKNAIMQQCNNEEEFVSKDTLCADAQAVKNKSSVPIPEPETEEKRKKRLAAEKKKKAELFFEECWNLYPVKKGKGKLSDACKTKVFKIGEEFKRCIERYIKDVKKRRTEFPELKYQNGSSFFNSGYVDYLDENFNKPDLLSPQKNKVTFEWSEDNVEYVLENGKRIAYMFEGRRVPLVNNNK